MNRKALKSQAKVTLKRHYWLILVLCLFAAFLGVEYGSTLWATDYQNPTAVSSAAGEATATSSAASDQLSSDGISELLGKIVSGDDAGAKQQVEQSQKNIQANDTNATLGRSRGVFAMVLNSFSTGSVMLSITDAASSILHSRGGATILLVLISLAVYLFVWLFIRETYLVTTRRMVLESRVYEQVPIHHMLFPLRTRKWPRIAWTMFVKSVFLGLWWLTIIGGIIKSFSYLLVPFIVAENPSIKACDAITLSRHMMKGHKRECFVAVLTFLGWDILSICTLGLTGIFYSNGYKASFWAEYYTYLRGLAKQADPCVHIVRAVVAVHHRNQITGRCCNQIQFFVNFTQFFFKNYHRKYRCTGRHISCAPCNRIRCHHTGSCISFRRAHWNSGF